MARQLTVSCVRALAARSETARASHQQPHDRPRGVRACNLGKSRSTEHRHGPGKDGSSSHACSAQGGHIDAKHVTHQTPGSSVSTFASARLPLTRGKSERGPTLVHPTGGSSTQARSPGGTAAWVISCRSAPRLSGLGPEAADSLIAEPRKSRHQHHEGSSPRRPNTLTRSLHRSAVAGRT